ACRCGREPSMRPAACSDASGAYAEYRSEAVAAQSAAKQAEAWSLFDPATRERHFATLRDLDELAAQSAAREDRAPRKQR
ncbi:MAG: hypothetical protein ACXWVL_09120, partial [Rhodoplanes sp.]